MVLGKHYTSFLAFIFSFFGEAFLLHAQVADFIMPDTICMGQRIVINNTSTGDLTHKWSFCEANWQEKPIQSNLHLPGLGWVTSGAFAQQDNEHYGFVLHGVGSKALSRLSFGSSFANNQPIVTPMGTFNNLINVNAGKDNMHLLHDGTGWFLFIAGNYTDPNTLRYPFVRLAFGSNLSNIVPVAEDLSRPGIFSGPEDAAFVNEGGNWFAFVCNSSFSSYINRVNFGSGLANTPTFTPLGNFGGLLLNPSRIQLFNHNGNKFALVFDPPLGRIVVLSFGSSYLNPPVASLLPIQNGMGNAVFAPACFNQFFGLSYNARTSPQWNLTSYSTGMGIIQVSPLDLSPVMPNVRHLKPVSDDNGSYVFFYRDGLFVFPPQQGDTLFRLYFKGCQGNAPPGSTHRVPPAFSFSEPGTYTVRLTINPGTSSEAIQCRQVVVLPDRGELNRKKVTLCAGSRVLLRPDGAPIPRHWSTGHLDTTIWVDRPGEYHARVMTRCGELYHIFDVQAQPANTLKITKLNEPACVQDSVRLKASGMQTYMWFPTSGMGNPLGEVVQVAPTVPTRYYLRGQDANGCSSTDSIFIEPASANSKNLYLVPNAFTPNGDGINDCFGVGHWTALQKLSFRIFDRWGQTVFFSQTISSCWDGNYAPGKQASTGTYIYKIEAESPCGIILRSGTVQLLR